MGHSGEILIPNGGGSPLSKIALHRTKCSALIRKMVAPSLREQLVNDVRGSKFSLLIDETTDCSTEKVIFQ